MWQFIGLSLLFLTFACSSFSHIEGKAKLRGDTMVKTKGHSNKTVEIKAVAFDLFGVLFRDRWKEWLKEKKEPLQRFIAQNKDVLPFRKEFDLRPHYPEYYSDLIHNNELGKISDKYFYYVLSAASGQPTQEIREMIHDTNVLNLEVVNVLHKLKNNYKIALITNADKEIVAEFLTENQHDNTLNQVFDAIIISAEVGVSKPDPRIFNKAAEKLGIPLNQMVFIDDSSLNTDAAYKLGILTILYDNQSQQELLKELEKRGVRIP